MTQYKKTYVNVLAYFSPDGSIHPLCIAFENGTCYLIDRVLRVVTAVSTKVTSSTAIRKRIGYRNQASSLTEIYCGEMWMKPSQTAAVSKKSSIV